MDWFYAKHGKQDGPVDVATLRGKLTSGEIAPTDLVWKEGMAEWTAAGDVAELSASPAPTAAPGGMLVQPGQVPGQPYVGQPYPGAYGPPMAPTCGMAIASMVCGIIGLMLCYFSGIVSLPAVICGHVAMKQINNAVVPMGGRGMAIAGLVTGYIGLAMQLAWIGALAFAVASDL